MSDLEFAPKSDAVARLAETVLNAVDSLVVALDPEGRVVQFNRACELATGYGFEEIRGVPFWDVFIAPERVEAAKARFLGWRDGACPTVFDLYWIKKDGRRRLISWTTTSVPEGLGESSLVVGTGVDVTERRAPVELASRLEERSAVTVLLVEDEPSILRFAAMALRMEGYEVIEAANAAEALAAAEACGGPIDLMVTDVVMPGLSGRDLAERMAAMRPGTRVLFMSGFAADDLISPEVAFLPKPFTSTDLYAKVRKVLAGAL